MLTKTQFTYEVMKMGENIKKADDTMKSDGYKIISTFTEVEDRQSVTKKVIEGYADALSYRIISGIFGDEDATLDETQNIKMKQIMITLLSGNYGWLNIHMAIKSLENMGIKFLDE